MYSARLRAFLLIVLSGCLQVASFPISAQLPYWREAFGWFALLPLLLALLPHEAEGTEDFRKHLGLGYLCGALFYLGNCYWIYQTMYLYGGLPKIVAFFILLLFAGYLGLYHALFAGLVTYARRSFGRTGALLLAPFFWVSVELARGRITGFPWDLLGYSQVDHAGMLRLAPVGGVMFISFLLTLGNCLLTYVVMIRDRRRRFAILVFACAALTSWMIFGKVQPAPRNTASAHAVLLQENLSVGATAMSDQPRSLGAELREFAGLSLAAADSASPDLVVWPEAPSHLRADDRQFRQGMQEFAQQIHSPLIIGSIGVDPNAAAARGYSLYDSATLFERSGAYAGRYDKIHLVPWGEYVPYKQLFAFAEKLTEGVGDMDPGTLRSVFRTDGHVYGVFICYESIFGDEVREFARSGAEVLVNISDDGWYGDTGAPWQHLNMARMRAVENDRWVLRDTNTGETTTIDPKGRYLETARHVRTAYTLPFGFVAGTTFYTRHGDWFAYACALVSVLAAGYGLLRGVLN